MKKFSKSPILMVLAVLFTLCITGPMTAFAATNPNLGAAATYSVLAQTGITGTGTISGDVGNNAVATQITALPASTVGGTIYSNPAGITIPGDNTTALPAAVQFDASAAYTTGIPGLGIEGTPIVGAELNGITRGPGVYDLVGATITLSGGMLTLDGPGTYIFRVPAILTSSGTINFINGARACDVFWRVGTGANINGSFAGTILSGTTIAFGAGVTLDGRALSVGGTAVTMLGNTISGPSCAAAPVPASSDTDNTITLFKNVINDNGGTSTYSDFPLFVNGKHVSSGESVNFPPGTYTVTETNLPNYKATFSGDCDATGKIIHGGVGTHNDICAIVNNDIGVPVVPIVPPLIDVVKVPSPLALPAGPGLVKYTYTTRNIGTVPMTNITMVGDTCSPIVLVSGDTNKDSKLDVNETWIYTCSTTLSKTHTNTVVATGLANGMTAHDVASATVIVGLPVVPPLIHVTKVPSPLTLLNGGGVATYTERITNPGTVALSNVKLTDDKCSPMKYISGDTNNDSKLATTETWTYTCQKYLTETTVNTATASGEANGLIVRDVALATVVVAAPLAPASPYS